MINLSSAFRYGVLILAISACGTRFAQSTFALAETQESAEKPCYLMPDGVEFDASIPTPKGFLGFELGELHIRHHQLVAYLQAVAAASDRVTIEQYAQSYGHRPLMMLTITSPANHERVPTLQWERQAIADPRTGDAVIDVESMPAVINMGYSVHGDESSAGNAVPGVVYYLAAAQGEQIERLLNEVVILVDPCLNPDGFDRFAAWANSYRGINLNDDPRHIEHNQGWPGGRVNYYWFDLNRDWLPGQHPESKGRLARYHLWKPNVVLDFHEMGTNSTFFFQPGVPQRTNPLTPTANVELTRRMGDYHARALDEIGSLYFTEEQFDDFYMGKGSTYPDLHGSVGILFEQASSRGHVQRNDNGLLTFPSTIRNQFTCSLSSLQATLDMRVELNQYLQDFYRQSLELGKSAESRGYAFTAAGDLTRLSEFAEILRRHDIDCYWSRRDLEGNGSYLPAYQTIVVPSAQPEYRFLLSLIERRTEFEENIFYDVSTWTLPLAFDLDSHALTELPDEEDLVPVDEVGIESLIGGSNEPAIAYVLPWTNYDAPRSLYALLDAGIKVRASQVPFTVESGGVELEFGYGSLVVPLGIQDREAEQVLAEIQKADPAAIYPVSTGLTPSGSDLGSNRFRTLEKPSAIMLIGAGVSRYEAGEVWHLLDTRIQMPLTIVDVSRFGGVDLDDYNVLIMVGGRYSSLSESSASAISDWVSEGGTLVASSSAVQWVGSQPWADIEFVADDSNNEKPADKSPEEESEPVSGSETEKEDVTQAPYAEARNKRALELISGAIFDARVDTTHPVGYGFTDNRLPVFRNNRIFLKPSSNPYANPVIYADQPLLSGYVSDENLERIGESAGVVVTSHGRGRAILISDNPNFRAYWYGTNRLFFNSIFFGQMVRVP